MQAMNVKAVTYGIMAILLYEVRKENNSVIPMLAYQRVSARKCPVFKCWNAAF